MEQDDVDGKAKGDGAAVLRGAMPANRTNTSTHSSHSHLSTVVMKNCDPFELGPAFAHERSPISGGGVSGGGGGGGGGSTGSG
jgi:hypothetical protein